MKISVVIPAYNASATIDAAIESVLGQARPADEIIVLDDGSTDDTGERMRKYGSAITVFTQANRGLAQARNVLCARAGGDVVSFLDSDDVWHPDYLRIQCPLFERYPNASAYFAGHITFHETAKLHWSIPMEPAAEQVIQPIDFLKLYNRAPGNFFPSFCSLNKAVLKEMGPEPFPPIFRRAEDFWLMNSLPLHDRPVVFQGAPVAAYRLTPGSLGSNRIENMGLALKACEMLAKRYDVRPDLAPDFYEAYASLRRSYGKLLMGDKRTREARTEIGSSLHVGRSLLSAIKSSMLMSLTYLPASLQPKWPSPRRAIEN